MITDYGYGYKTMEGIAPQQVSEAVSDYIDQSEKTPQSKQMQKWQS